MKELKLIKEKYYQQTELSLFPNIAFFLAFRRHELGCHNKKALTSVILLSEREMCVREMLQEKLTDKQKAGLNQISVGTWRGTLRNFGQGYVVGPLKP